MFKMDNASRKKAAIKKELEVLKKKEESMSKVARENKRSGLTERLEEKIPEKMCVALEKTFCKAFAIIFEKGTDIIEKSFDKERVEEDYDIQNYAVKVRGTRRELHRMEKNAKISGAGNMAIAAVEGVGLGVLGIGLPDIVVFIGVLLKGIYETALYYGIDYHAPEERMLILKMMETAVSSGEEWERLNTSVDEYMKHEIDSSYPDIEMQVEQTARAFAVDMLLLKFVQGLPVIGILGGIGNPVYYSKVMKYVRIKYQKRYLWMLEAGDIKEGAINSELINIEQKQEVKDGLSQTVTFGTHSNGEPVEVILYDSEHNYKKVIVNHKSYFEDFPGIEKGSWTKYLERKFDFYAGRVEFRTSFEAHDDGYRCLWEIQPDGRYWADGDGFGMEDGLEIVLFADLNSKGEFKGPFRIYMINEEYEEEME